ncbi:MAG: hypothetical protein V1927_03285 [Candidatus Omnitrophota bacterium]
MRRELVVFAAILAVLLVLGLFGRSLITGIAVREIKDAFPGYNVSIGSVELRNIDMLAITGINIKKGKALSCGIKALEIKFSPLSLFTKKVPKITIKGTRLKVDSRNKKLKDLVEYPVFNTGKGFIVRSVVISDLVVWVYTADWRLNVGVDGDIKIHKTPTGDAEIKGDFLILPGSEKLAINDKDFLKRLAQKAKQPLAVIEDLKDYDYTKCNLQISGKPGSISLHVMLDGANGKKDLTIPLSGF